MYKRASPASISSVILTSYKNKYTLPRGVGIIYLLYSRGIATLPSGSADFNATIVIGSNSVANPILFNCFIAHALFPLGYDWSWLGYKRRTETSLLHNQCETDAVVAAPKNPTYIP